MLSEYRLCERKTIKRPHLEAVEPVAHSAFRPFRNRSKALLRARHFRIHVFLHVCILIHFPRLHLCLHFILCWCYAVCRGTAWCSDAVIHFGSQVLQCFDLPIRACEFQLCELEGSAETKDWGCFTKTLLSFRSLAIVPGQIDIRMILDIRYQISGRCEKAVSAW